MLMLSSTVIIALMVLLPFLIWISFVSSLKYHHSIDWLFEMQMRIWPNITHSCWSADELDVIDCHIAIIHDN